MSRSRMRWFPRRRAKACRVIRRDVRCRQTTRSVCSLLPPTKQLSRATPRLRSRVARVMQSGTGSRNVRPAGTGACAVHASPVASVSTTAHGTNSAEETSVARAQHQHAVLVGSGDADARRQVERHDVVDTVLERAVGDHVVNHTAGGDDGAIARLLDAFDVLPDRMVGCEGPTIGSSIGDLPCPAQVRRARRQRIGTPGEHRRRHLGAVAARRRVHPGNVAHAAHAAITAGTTTVWRRERDSNPRSSRSRVFKTPPFGHSGIPPRTRVAAARRRRVVRTARQPRGSTRSNPVYGRNTSGTTKAPSGCS